LRRRVLDGRRTLRGRRRAGRDVAREGHRDDAMIDRHPQVGAQHRLHVAHDVLGGAVGPAHDVDLHQLVAVGAHAHAVHVAQATDGGFGPAGKGGIHHGHAS